MGQPSGRYLVTKRDRSTHVSRMRILDGALLCQVEVGYTRASTVMVQRWAGVEGRPPLPLSVEGLAAPRRGPAPGDGAQVAQAAASTAEFRAPDGSPDRIDEAVAAMWLRFQELYFRAATEL